ncbi:hypothetical protein EKO04_000973 [Ascochyta lentis]|uniref:Heterokaryon incompatibility domain-containing protein n=1 Tax=Ascochyta lentis TaxID=205686 RepID=A0A8H7JDG6_9PLEO|nr:hypothetical protein EKO04_000973 [Ascochyta lentis]
MIRLINTKTRKLCQFEDDAEIPKYAILSHTWGDAEVSFREFGSLSSKNDSSRQARIKSKAGYLKIERACREATRDKIDWVWVDTCCIDQGSSTELSEAINSFFKRYREAHVCFAYLDDVLARKSDTETDMSRMNKKGLGEARWFTRGWTLQELIAPRKVEFFDMDWKFLGTRRSLRKVLATITKINESVLAGKAMDQICIARRMRWAAGRQTKREEDVAYSLLGIFGVTMSIIYGEGKKSAFRRLQRQIVDANGDQTLFAWQPRGALKMSDRTPPVRMDDNEGLDLFASDPAEFVFNKADQIVPTARRGPAPSTITLGTDVGVTVEKMASQRGFFIGILACSLKDKPNDCLVVVLQRRQNGYVRHHKAALLSYELAQKSRSVDPGQAKNVPS